MCVEVAGIAGPPACPQEQYTRADGEMALIKAAHPFTEAVEDSATGGGQQWSKSPFGLLCGGFEAVPLPEQIFDDLNDCYGATSECGYFGCKCDAMVSLFTKDVNPGEYWENSLTNDSTAECTDPRFSF